MPTRFVYPDPLVRGSVHSTRMGKVFDFETDKTGTTLALTSSRPAQGSEVAPTNVGESNEDRKQLRFVWCGYNTPQVLWISPDRTNNRAPRREVGISVEEQARREDQDRVVSPEYHLPAVPRSPS